MKRFKPLVSGVAVVLFWGLLWLLLAYIIRKPLLFPSPIRVVANLSRLIVTAEFWLCTAATLLRIFVGIAVAFVLGVGLACLTAKIKALDTLFSPLLSVVKSTPVSSFVLLLLVFVGRDILPSIICALIVLPVVWANVSEGLRHTDPKLLEVASIYRFSKLKTIQTIYLPSVMPYFISACRSSLGLAWKAGIAAEVLSVPGVSIGKHLFDAKLYFETEALFAWTLAVIILSLLIERLVIRIVGRLSAQKAFQEVRS